jgi:hypothetical protein
VVTGPGEQQLPGLAGVGRVTVMVAGDHVPGGLLRWTAAVSRVEPGSAEWDEVIGPLVAGRLNAVLPEGETSPAQRWARSGDVFRLAPVSGDTVSDDTTAPAEPGHRRAHPLMITGVGGTGEAVPPTPPGSSPEPTSMNS